MDGADGFVKVSDLMVFWLKALVNLGAWLHCSNVQIF